MIRAFVSCFNADTLDVWNLDQSTTMSVLMSDLQKNDLKWSLTKTYLKDFRGMLARAEKYARMKKTFILERAPSTSTLGGGERTQRDEKTFSKPKKG